MELLNAGGGAAADVAATKEFWVPVTKAASMEFHGHYPVGRLNASWERANISFHVPHDFTSITEAYIVIIPKTSHATAPLDIYSMYASVGEAYNTHSESDEATTYNITDDQIFEIDISGILTSLSAGDYVGVAIVSVYAGDLADVLGVRFKYS
jgi:hypothetical protein